MRLLIDENISFRILKIIDAHYPGSTHVTSIKKDRVTDPEIWSYAKKHDFVSAGDWELSGNYEILLPINRTTSGTTT